MALADARALDDPFVAGVHLHRELGVANEAFGQIAAGTGDDCTRHGACHCATCMTLVLRCAWKLSRSSRMRRAISSATRSWATRMALAKPCAVALPWLLDRKSTRLNSSP